ncbi:MAG: hypothetical protein GWO11_00150 [Desulfuromonadales bacterium]|nr:hypothetical protein [Desulfuromonadales bacterium]NIR32947.1 hypothetical protein [Desulfuromonadales bacterium]NIS39850.1 hypothetical protein [Desulfuromonadales bacterium]
MNNHIETRTPLGSTALVTDPAVAGIFGFALCCLSVGMNLSFPLMKNVPVAGFGLVAGGVLQLLGGLAAWSRGQETASVAFCAAGLFFLSLLPVMVFPEFGLGIAPDRMTLGSYLVMWALFFGIMTPGLRRHCPALALPTVLQCGALTLFTLALAVDHAPLARIGGAMFLGAGLVTSLAIIAGIFRNGSAPLR